MVDPLVVGAVASTAFVIGARVGARLQRTHDSDLLAAWESECDAAHADFMEQVKMNLELHDRIAARNRALFTVDSREAVPASEEVEWEELRRVLGFDR